MKIKHNRGAYKQILTGPEVQKLLAREVSSRAERAGDGYESEVEVGPNRARGAIWTGSREAIEDTAVNNTLVRVLGD